MALAAGVWFFYKEDVEVAPTVPAKPEVSYEVSEIKAVQTSAETGETEYTLTADSLVQTHSGEDEMVNAAMTWTPPEGETYHISAKRAKLDQETGDLQLADGAVLTRKATQNKPELVITGDVFVGNTKARTVHSDSPVMVMQGEDRFSAQRFSADLQSGEYEFYQIEILYNAAERKDKPLF
ncbi:Uncharacterized protein conserved in bacteria [Moraxella caviae]|nr:Uncharacterized protein conserved in bacteria [Moraxella caviae]VEW10468.1 Uncharacterized protein conserved in bacteria [Moraxella caviae]